MTNLIEKSTKICQSKLYISTKEQHFQGPTLYLRQADLPLAARLPVGRAVQPRLRDVLPQRGLVREHARRDAAHELAVGPRLHERRAAVQDPVELVAVEADREQVRRRDRGRGGRRARGPRGGRRAEAHRDRARHDGRRRRRRGGRRRGRRRAGGGRRRGPGQFQERRVAPRRVAEVPPRARAVVDLLLGVEVEAGGRLVEVARGRVEAPAPRLALEGRRPRRRPPLGAALLDDIEACQNQVLLNNYFLPDAARCELI